MLHVLLPKLCSTVIFTATIASWRFTSRTASNQMLVSFFLISKHQYPVKQNHKLCWVSFFKTKFWVTGVSVNLWVVFILELLLSAWGMELKRHLMTITDCIPYHKKYWSCVAVVKGFFNSFAYWNLFVALHLPEVKIHFPSKLPISY